MNKVLLPRRLTDWLDRGRLGVVLLPLLGSALCVLVEKFATMKHLRAFTFIAASLRTPPRLSLTEAFSLYRADLLWGFVLLPMAFCLLTLWLAPRARVVAATFVACVVQVVIILEVLSFITTGSFSSLALLWFAAKWAITNHNTSFYPHPVAAAVLVLADFAFAGLLLLIAFAALKRNLRWINRAVLTAFAGGAVVAAVAYMPSVPPMPWSHSLLQMTVYPALFQDHSDARLDAETIPQLLANYRANAKVPIAAPASFTAKAANYNVLVFVMESMAAEAFDPARDSLSDLPNVRRLRDHSFLLQRDFTSYPLTDDATFSIFTGMYLRMEHGVLNHRMQLPSLIRSLRNDGYQTGFYGFVWDMPTIRDSDLLASLGFAKIAAPPTTPEDASGGVTFFGPVSYVERNDRWALHALVADIHTWTAHQQRFAAAYFPEVGHDPYRELDGKADQSIVQRGHALAVLQDAWLGEILDELQRDGALDHTIIVITGDHGIRYIAKPGELYHPYFAFHGTLQDSVLRVPGLIYVPGVLRQPVSITQPTSHVDLAPTVLDLLGVSNGRGLEQGLPVYSPAVSQRRLFLKMDFMGAAGYYDRGSYYSRSAMGIVYKSPMLDFDLGDIVRYDSPEAQTMRGTLEQFDANQTALIGHVLAGH